MHEKVAKKEREKNKNECTSQKIVFMLKNKTKIDKIALCLSILPILLFLKFNLFINPLLTSMCKFVDLIMTYTSRKEQVPSHKKVISHKTSQHQK